VDTATTHTRISSACVGSELASVNGGWRSRSVKAGVMSARKTISVIRTYRPECSHQARALALLLKKSVRKEATRPGGPDDAKEINDCAATTNSTR
jgi:hypothetical protein